MNIMTKRGQLDNIITYQHICDTNTDMPNILSDQITLGSVCIVLQGESGGLQVYIANSQKQWQPITTGISGGSGGGESSLQLYVCNTNEYSQQTGTPTISTPNSNTIYLVPNNNESDLYTEWIYINNSWQHFGNSAAAQAERLNAEAWAVGKRNGTNVSSNDPTYHNNAKYYAEQAFSGTPEGYADLVGDVGDLKSAFSAFDSALNITKETPYSTVNSWRLNAEGLAVQNVKYKFIKYEVTAGDKIFIRTKTDRLNQGASFQFQTNSSVGAQSNPYIVGSPYLEGYAGYITVPENATYLIISALLTDDAECGVFKVVKLEEIDGKISELESDILDKVEYEIFSPFTIANGWGLKPSGLSVKRTSYRLLKYKVAAGTKIYLKTFVTIDDAATYQFQSDSSVSSTSNPYIIGSPVTTAAHGIVSVPEGATWLIISALKTDDESGVYVVPGMHDLENRVSILEERTGTAQIVKDNQDATNKILASRWLRSTTAVPLTLLWFSDIHRDKTALERIIEYKNYLNGLEMLDDTIATGDLVYGSSQDASSDTHYWENFWENTPGTEDILISIGNHEYYQQGSGTHGKISMSDISDYFLSGIDNWGVVRESDNSFYYKDYEDQNIRLIVCDPAIESEADETAWLEDTLEGAKTLGYSVIIASHTLRLNYTTAITSATVIDNSWTDSETKKSETISLTYDWTSSCDIADCVSNFIEGGGSFLCYLIGHQHWDRLMYPTGHPDQLIICVAAATDERVQTKLTSNDLPRYENTRTQDCFNVVTFDAENKIIKCVRVGSNMTMYEQPRTAFAYDVANHRFLSVI